MWCSEMCARQRWLLRSGLLALALFLSACGFQPLYGERSGGTGAAAQAMAETRIALIAANQAAWAFSIDRGRSFATTCSIV